MKYLKKHYFNNDKKKIFKTKRNTMYKTNIDKLLRNFS